MSDEQLDELISCYLDGELSQQETHELESRLQSDPEAARRLRLLREARNALTASQTYRLPDDFAARVLAAAQAEAERLDLPAQHPIRLAGKQSVPAHGDKPVASPTLAPVTRASAAAHLPPHSQLDRSKRSTWAYAAAAAALVMAAFVGWQSRQTPSNPITNQIAQDDKSLNALEQNGSQADVPAVNVPALDNATLPPESELAIGDPPKDNSEAIRSDSAANISSVANADSANKRDMANEVANPAVPTPSLDSDTMVKDLASAEGSLGSLDVLMVIDVTLTKEAWENKSFSRILNEYGIRYEQPVVADQSLSEALETSKLIAKSGTDGTPVDPTFNPNVGDIELVFVQARAARIDNAVKDIFERIEEYPSLYFDLSMDGPCQEIVTRLESSTPFQNDGEEVFGIATAVQNNNPGLAEKNEFAGSKPRGAAVPLANRQKKEKPALETPTPEDPVSMNPVSTVLFILRKPEGATGRP